MSLVNNNTNTLDSRAAIWTIAIHILLLLLFLFVKYSPPQIDPVEDMGMEVNLGTMLDGYGTEQPMAVGDPAPDNEISMGQSSAADIDMQGEILESNDPDAPVVNANDQANNASNNRTTNTNTIANNQRPANRNRPRQTARYVYGGATGTGGNSAANNSTGSSEGNTTGNGDRGVPGGTAGADNYEGTPGAGGGVSHTISGRNIIAFPTNEGEFKESGKVTIRVTVNKAGIITDKRIVISSSSELSRLALKKLIAIRFNKSDAAPEEQFGNITFVFKTRS